MKFKKRNKFDPESSMSSLNDIIFLLLVFFMLTSPSFQVNFDIAESNSKTTAPGNIAVSIKKDGTYLFNGKETIKEEIPARVGQELKIAEPKFLKDATLTIVAEKGVQWQMVYEMMEIANQNNMKAIIATQPKKT